MTTSLTTTTAMKWMRLCHPTTTTTTRRVPCGLRCLATSSSPRPTPIPQPSTKSPSATNPEQFNRSVEELRNWSRTGEEPEYALGKHRSNALELVHKVPIVEVDGEMAICDGGGGALGHPLEYISLKRPGAVEDCKYCSLRYTKKTK